MSSLLPAAAARQLQQGWFLYPAPGILPISTCFAAGRQLFGRTDWNCLELFDPESTRLTHLGLVRDKVAANRQARYHPVRSENSFVPKRAPRPAERIKNVPEYVEKSEQGGAA